MVDQYLLFQARYRQEFSEPGSKGERLGVDFGKNTLDLSTIRIRNDDADLLSQEINSVFANREEPRHILIWYKSLYKNPLHLPC